jgi:hypothetical protein
MPRLYLEAGNKLLGSITESDLELLVDQLEETELADDDYFIDAPTVDILEQAGASSGLVSLLRGAIGQSEGVDIRWEK